MDRQHDRAKRFDAHLKEDYGAMSIAPDAACTTDTTSTAARLLAPRPIPRCKIKIQTGDYYGAGTFSNFNIVLYDEDNQPTTLTKYLQIFMRNTVKSFDVELPEMFKRVVKIEIWHSNWYFSPNWYINVIEVKHSQHQRESIFPIFRWIQPINADRGNRYKIMELDTILPQFDKYPQQRRREIESKRQSYEIKCVNDNIPMVKEVPSHERFSPMYWLHIIILYLWNAWEYIKLTLKWYHWTSLNDIDDMYDTSLKKPASRDHWREDWWFGNQRLVGCNPALITLCTEIPEKFGVTEKMMKPVLKNETLASLINKKRLFYTDICELDGLQQHEDFEICSPMALFMLDHEGRLIPIAIKLNQKKEADNPVFLPTDDKNVWLLAKMWYNNADAAFHQVVLHLGGTHLLMEGVILALQRNVSQSHPIMKLLQPHTLFLFNINSDALKLLLSKQGFINTTMNIGSSNAITMVSNFKQKWRFDLHGTPPAEFKSRNVEDPKVLPNYHFRHDSLLIYDIIRKYVTDYVHLYYDDDDILLKDYEMQNWAKDLAKETCSSGGIGMAGIPEKNGKSGFYTTEDLVMVLSAVIYTCSAGHSAVNFLQYDEYGYPPNYPALMRGKVIRDKSPRTEEDLFKAAPDPYAVFRIMLTSGLLSTKGTNSLGDFEIQYIYDPKAVKIVTKFRTNLREASDKIWKRNQSLLFPYEVLLPEIIPNAISI